MLTDFFMSVGPTRLVFHDFGPLSQETPPVQYVTIATSILVTSQTHDIIKYPKEKGCG